MYFQLFHKGIFITRLLRLDRCASLPGLPYSSNCISPDIVQNFTPKKALLLSKMTKHEFLRSLEQCADEEHLNLALLRRGVDVDFLRYRHDLHCRKLSEIQRTLRSRGLEVKVVGRSDYHVDAIAWADVVFTAGGDGTFLLGASKIHNRTKPLIGINTDPDFSYGYLCLPRSYTSNFHQALDSLLAGNFEYFWRSRIRVTMWHHRDQPVKPGLLDKRRPVATNGPDDFAPPVLDCSMASLIPQHARDQMIPTVLPVVALNEVYIGDALGARVSHYEISVDGDASVRQKSSGILVSTGTGSTSWYKQVTAVSPQTVAHLLSLARAVGYGGHNAKAPSPIERHYSSPPDQTNAFSHGVICLDSVAAEVARQYNDSLRLDPTDARMAYVVRDPMCNAVFNVDKPRGLATNLQVRSLMLDAQLVFDGGYTYPFPYGSVAVFSTNEQDPLCCVRLRDCGS
ncbi:unnamed protein product [Dicrocoelium dendriticum]|nr:unnamed protein product [Dicrocoelium dendriticum]